MKYIIFIWLIGSAFTLGILDDTVEKREDVTTSDLAMVSFTVWPYILGRVCYDIVEGE